jgi:hypothetical protein
VSHGSIGVRREELFADAAHTHTLTLTHKGTYAQTNLVSRQPLLPFLRGVKGIGRDAAIDGFGVGVFRVGHSARPQIRGGAGGKMARRRRGWGKEVRGAEVHLVKDQPGYAMKRNEIDNKIEPAFCVARAHACMHASGMTGE